MLRSSIIVVFVAFALISCNKLTSPDNQKLLFSSDTILFDTVFTSIGSTTRELRVINHGNRRLILNHIYLSGGRLSQFRLNIDGEATFDKSNIEIEPGDSIFIFVDVIVNPSDMSSPVLVSDSIIFNMKDETQKVLLVAWGQDIVLINNKRVGTETWHRGKPYVIYNNITIDTSETLTIDEGTKIYFHRNSSMVVAGNIVVNGSEGSQVLFASDRLEKMYEDVPGQWKGIFLLNTSRGNSIDHAIIRNGIYGIQMGETQNNSNIPELKLFSSFIMHSTISGLSAASGKIQAVNLVITHCGNYCIYLGSGGEFSFKQCTFFNRWDYGLRLSPLLYVTNLPENPGSHINMEFDNCVIYGDKTSEIDIKNADKMDYVFDHCLLKLDTISSPFWNRFKFPNALINLNPLFLDVNRYDFRPDTLSPMINHGNPVYSTEYPLDIRGISRTSDGLPDIGAFERVFGELIKIR